MNLQKLQAQRDAQRQTIQKYLDKLEDAKLCDNMVKFDTVFKSLESKVSLLATLNEKILSNTDVPGINEEILSTDDYTLELEIQLGDLRAFRDKRTPSTEITPPSVLPAESDSNPVAHSSLAQMQSSQLTTQTASSVSSQYHRLPKLELPNFDGDVLHWQSFWDSFETSVHLNPNLTNVQKFNYLKSQLGGDAARTVEGFALTNANYSRAVDLLKERFGQEHRIIHATMQALLNLPVPSNTIQSMRHFCDKMEAFIRGLESLGQQQEAYGTLLVPIIIDKLPADVRKSLARIQRNQNWQLGALRRAINDEIYIMEAGDSPHLPDAFCKSTVTFYAGARSKTDRHSETKRQKPSYRKPTTTTSPTCLFCGDNHTAVKCEKYSNVEQRLTVVREKQLCYNCLGSHQVSKCRSNRRCLTCRKKHHTSICQSTATRSEDQTRPPTTSAARPEAAVLHASSRPMNSAVLLKTATATVASTRASTYANILFDEGAQRSFITQNLADKLQLQSVGRETIHLSSFGNYSNKTMTLETAEVQLVTDSREYIPIQVLVVPTIATPINNSVMRNVSDLPYLRGLKLANTSLDTDTITVNMLIGADHYWSVVEDHVIRGNGPTAVKSKVGYLLSGPVSTSNHSNPVSHIMDVLTCRDTDVQALERFWTLENAGITQETAEQTDNEYLRQYQENSLHYEDGQYVAKLPWKQEHPILPSNRNIAYRRVEHTIQRLSREPDMLRKYGQIISDQEQRGFIEKVPIADYNSQRAHYIPHHPVRKESSTTPVRIVYDCSCRQSNDHPSLNDCLESRPPQLNDLTSILVRFRFRRYGVATDIEKAFLHVGLHPQDRDFTRFFWLSDPYDPGSSLITYRFRAVLFGATCSPFILNATLLKHLYQHRDMHTASILQRDLYVDNVISSFDQSDELNRYFYESRKLLSEAGMNLRAWTSNNKQLRSNAADENVFDSDPVTKVLGLRWEPEKDTLSFVTREIPTLQTITKRDILRYSSQIYDPLGLLSPVTIRAKILMQELWKDKHEWDVPLPATYLLKWNLLAQDLNQATSLKFKRHYFDLQTSRRKSFQTPVQLHVFVDASVKSYGAVAYICSNQQSTLVMAKNRIAPIKPLTIPQLELMAAVVGARLSKHLTSAFPTPTQITYWSDSKIVLHWLASTKTLKRFVKNRVHEIHELTGSQQWRYCPTYHNPADLLTRGISAEAFLNSKLWQTGPTWLPDRQQWPECDTLPSVLPPALEQTTTRPDETGDDADITHDVISLQCISGKQHYNIGHVIDVTRYSKLVKLVRVTAYVIRFIENCRLPRQQRLKEHLNVLEIENAQKKWIYACQSEEYAREIEELKSKNVKSTIVRQLRLFLDNEGFLRCGGRIHNSPLNEFTKFPYLLPKNHSYTRLLVLAAHERQLHAGLVSTITSLREKYWIPSIRQCIQSVIRKCVVCRKVAGQPYAIPDPPPLPKDRVADSQPFTVTGVDFTGALYVRDTRGHESKAYVCLFTCASTRAVHLELVPDLSEDTYLQAFRRFCSRKSTPRIMISDNATTYCAAASTLKKLYTSLTVANSLSKSGIEWKFIPKRAPWYGGWWERLIGLTKQVLKKVLGRSYVSFLELQTILTEVEAVMNDRPLTYVTSDSSDAEALTPSHLIYGRRITTPPETDVSMETLLHGTASNNAIIKKRARIQQTLVNHFRERWRREYLTALREHHRVVGNNKQSISIGDVVQVHDETPRSKWKLAVIEDLVTGRDGHTRSAIIRTDGGTTNRPIAKLYPLEVTSPTP